MVIEKVSEGQWVEVGDVIADNDRSARGRDERAASPILLHDEIEQWPQEERDDFEDWSHAERTTAWRIEAELSGFFARHALRIGTKMGHTAVWPIVRIAKVTSDALPSLLASSQPSLLASQPFWLASSQPSWLLA